MRFGQNAVRTPGRTHVNGCVTKGVKFRARSPRARRAQVQGGAPVAHRRGRNSFRIFPEGAFLRPALTGRYAPLRARLLRRRRVSERNRRRRLLARRSGETPQNEPGQKRRAKNREAKKGCSAILS